jgi:penicillin amidase
MRRALAVVGVLAVLVLLVSLWALVQLRSSLPLLEGTVTASELSASVTVARDEHSVPTLTGCTRADLAWVLGFLHAQERFFQMGSAQDLCPIER